MAERIATVKMHKSILGFIPIVESTGAVVGIRK